MDIDKENKCLTNLYHKHGLSFGWHLETPEETNTPIFLLLRCEKMITFFYELILFLVF